MIQYNLIVKECFEQIVYNGHVYNGFYISFNTRDINIYGDCTTALVLGQMERFFILNGNHCEEYKQCNSFYECINYYKKNIAYNNKYSDTL